MRVLVVEDEPDLARALRRAFTERGFACDTAADGESGLFNARSWSYDAVILDLMLPRLDGWTLLERLRLDRKTPVLVLTARDTRRDKLRLLNGGADDYMTKPFDLEELIARVRALIRRAAGAPARVLRVGGVALDTAAREVTKDGRPVPLAGKEYALLELLALRRGRLVTRTMIYDHLWDEEDPTLSNVADVYVASLRRKLGHELIRTRRGEGYLIP